MNTDFKKDYFYKHDLLGSIKSLSIEVWTC